MKYPRITVNPHQMEGVPCIRELQIPVVNVVAMVAEGKSDQEILNAYPVLEKEDITEALQYNMDNNIRIIEISIWVCIEMNLIQPALILIYSGIDTVGWLDSKNVYATRKSFINWVDKYLLKAKPLQCNSIDLYSARCGLLHTLTPESELRSKGKARYINYGYSNANVNDFQRTIDLQKKTTEQVAVHINDLYDAWCLGIQNFTEDIRKDPVRQSRVHKRAAKFFSQVSPEIVSMALDKLDQDTNP